MGVNRAERGDATDEERGTWTWGGVVRRLGLRGEATLSLSLSSVRGVEGERSVAWSLAMRGGKRLGVRGDAEAGRGLWLWRVEARR